MLALGVTFPPGPVIHDTVISFPSFVPALCGLTFPAPRVGRLSFLVCDFLPPPLPIDELPTTAFSTFPSAELTPDLWHRRLGHAGKDITRVVLTKPGYATGVSFVGDFSDSKCIPCIIGKAPQAPYLNPSSRPTKLLELVHVDIMGPFPVPSPRHGVYLFDMVDGLSTWVRVTELRLKSGSFKAFTQTQALWEKATGNQILAVRLDGAKEFVEGKLGDHLRNAGIRIQLTAPYAHAQAGFVERRNRTLQDGGQALNADAGGPPSMIFDAVLCHAYVRNRLPSSVLPATSTPYSLMHNGDLPDLAHLRPFGCRCYPFMPHELRKKGGPRRFEAIFVGYEEDRVGWKVRDKSGKYWFSRDVIFNELESGFPSASPFFPPLDDSLSIGPQDDVTIPYILLNSASAPPPPSSSSSSPLLQFEKSGVRVLRSRNVSYFSSEFCFSSSVLSDTILQRDSILSFLSIDCSPYFSFSVVQSFLALDSSSMISDFSDSDSVVLASMLDGVADIRDASGLPTAFAFDNDEFFGLAAYSPFHRTSFDLTKAPESYREAMARTDASVWKSAMQREYDSLQARQAFIEADLPPGKKAIRLQWVFAFKYNPDGSIIVGKEKSRLVADGKPPARGYFRSNICSCCTSNQYSHPPCACGSR